MSQIYYRSDIIIDKLKIINCGNYYTIANQNGKYQNHAHVNKRDTAELLCKLIKRKTLPKSNYLIESARRITIDEKYKCELKLKQERNRDKQKYHNIQNGIRR